MMLRRGLFAGALYAGLLFGPETAPVPEIITVTAPQSYGGLSGRRTGFHDLKETRREQNQKLAKQTIPLETIDIQDILTMVAKTWL